ncbi:hypothetical protein ABIC44_002862 [Sphingomonas sp. 1185]
MGQRFDMPLVFQPDLSKTLPVLWSLRPRTWDLKKSRYTEEQITFALNRAETGTPVTEVIRPMGISEQTFFRWKKGYGGLGAGGLRQVKQAEEGTGR